MSYQNERWFGLLKQAVEASSAAEVSRRLSEGFERKYSRPAISQVMHGNYGADTCHIARRVLAVYDSWLCPFTKADIKAEDCRAVYQSETPSHNPLLLAQRRVCRSCKYKEKSE